MQLLEVFSEKGVLEIFANFTVKKPVLNTYFDKYLLSIASENTGSK